MDRIIYNSLSSYYHALEQLGYMNHTHAQKLLLLVFYRDFCYGDFRGLLSKEDYHLIEKALDCLWGSSCLIPYPDYLKMGRLDLGKMTELSTRIKNLEGYSEELDERLTANDTQTQDNTDRLDAHDARMDQRDIFINNIDSHFDSIDAHLEEHDSQLENHEERVTAIEQTKVVKGKNLIQNIPDIDLPAFDTVVD